ncbi:MAG: hypothetical protein R3E66_02760 [bacterium]
MSQTPKKLHIPDPTNEDSTEIFGVVELGLVASALLGVVLFYLFLNQAPIEQSAPRGATDVAESETVERLSAALRAEKSRASALDALKPSELSSRAWTDEEFVSVVRFGKRATSEAACDARAAQFAANTVADTMRLELVKALDRRSESAPYACLSRLYFEDKLPQEDVRTELVEFWSDAANWTGNARLVAEVLERFRTTRVRPQSPAFDRWLRACGLNFDYEANPACLQLINQLSPAQGGDLVLTAIKHMEQPGLEKDDYINLTGSIGRLARNGQPPAFKVTQTPALPDYDVDFRQAAVFLLCRFTNSPDDDIAFAAAEELTKTAHFAARSYDRNVLLRWREGCRLAFTGESENVPNALLGVWNGEEGTPPDYRLSTEVAGGYCAVEEGYPSWYCGSKLFLGKGPLDKALEDVFVKTAWIEWVDK